MVGAAPPPPRPICSNDEIVAGQLNH